jgi:hypothetical protein
MSVHSASSESPPATSSAVVFAPLLMVSLAGGPFSSERGRGREAVAGRARLWAASPGLSVVGPQGKRAARG